jgi:hypothetical protein
MTTTKSAIVMWMSGGGFGIGTGKTANWRLTGVAKPSVSIVTTTLLVPSLREQTAGYQQEAIVRILSTSVITFV